jgi:hypothetical protein
MENTLGVLLTPEQLNTTIDLLDSVVANLKGRLPETHSGVDRLLIESAIIETNNLIDHYKQFQPANNTEPEETPLEVEGI